MKMKKLMMMGGALAIVVAGCLSQGENGQQSVTVQKLKNNPSRIIFAKDGKSAIINKARLKDDNPSAEELKNRLAAMKARAEKLLIKSDPNVGARTRPMMGWSSWNTFGINISEDLILGVAKAMATNGLKEAGFIYVNIDDGMFGGRDKEGNLRFHPERFPNGMKPVVDGIHALGMRAGTYSDGGDNTCASWSDLGGRGAGLLGHDAADCKLYFNDLKFDYIKVDYCGGDRLKIDPKKRFPEIAKAIEATGCKDVRFNICNSRFLGTWMEKCADSWRVAGDIRANWDALKVNIMNSLFLSSYASPGHYNDLDMLEVGHLKGQTKTAFGDADKGLTRDEEMLHFGMWSILSSPLILGCDPRNMPQSTIELVSNPYLLAMNQNDLGLQAYVVSITKDRNELVFVKDADAKYGTARYVAVVNLADDARKITVRARDIDLSGRIDILDLAERVDAGSFTDEVVVSLPAHSAKFYRFDAEKRLDRVLYEGERAYLTDIEMVRCEQGYRWPSRNGAGVCDGAYSGKWVVNNLGGKESNDLNWKDVYVSEAGDYELAIKCGGRDCKQVFLQVDGGQKFAFDVNGKFDVFKTTVKLAAGEHVVRLSNPTEKFSVDYMTVTRK